MRLCVSNRSSFQLDSLRIMVGLSKITSSRLLNWLLRVPNNSPQPEDCVVPGKPLESENCVCFIRPPMATILPSCTRTTLSVSFTALLASGRTIFPYCSPRSIIVSLDLTRLIDGCTCKTTLLSSSICGVTSSAMPEKNGCRVTDGAVPCIAVVDWVPRVILVTKNSSTPTLSTAF